MKALLAAPSALVILVAAGVCPSNPTPSGGRDLFRLAVNGAPGGALLAAWVVPAGEPQAFLVGGYVGVDRAAVPQGRVGRLVEYTRGRFTTRCSTDQVLWWVDAVSDAAGQLTVYAAGEGGRVIRYRSGQCETLELGLTFPQGAPTFWGLVALRPDEVWLVGGSAAPDGPRGVVVTYDGARFTQQTNLPPSAQGENLYKIARGQSGQLFVVGSAGVAIRRDQGASEWVEVPVTGARTSDNRLFTVSCASECLAVGGAGRGLVLRGGGTGWSSVTDLGGVPVDDLPGLNGVWVQNSGNIFIVGNNGETVHVSFGSAYRPPAPLTNALLHGVAGGGSVVVAVGGELSTTDASQRAVVLVRGDESSSFDFDGQTYMATGQLRSSLGGAGQGGGR